METIGYFCSITIGIVLGLIGGGGSILTVPVLVYLFQIDAVLATAYSLFIVGITSAVGSLEYFRKGLVNIKTAIVFGIPSIIAVFYTRAILLPLIPKTVFSFRGIVLSKNTLLLLLFSLLMIAAAYSMLRNNKTEQPKENDSNNFKYGLILIEGFLVGILTGLVGAGGGFLIIPALVLLSNLPMKEAIGTSLAIIAAKSLIGFLGEESVHSFDWFFLTKISGIAIIGIFLGSYLSQKIEGNKLKPAFGWFVLLMGIYIIIKETLLK